MRKLPIFLVCCTAALSFGASMAGCGDEAKPTGGTGGDTSSSNSSGSSDKSSSSSGTTATCQELTGDIKTNTTLTADKCYLLKSIAFVEPGVTLTIEPGTTIQGDSNTKGTLIIRPGAQINAVGTPDKPIVFTSAAPVGSRKAGDWGGVMLLGNAPINAPGGKAKAEGVDPVKSDYGGTNPNDNSGTLKYIRIEFSGVLFSPENELNGLTFNGVGAGTTVEYIMVHETLDDCFEFFGGTVNAKHLICANNGDDGFDWDFGYKGKLQFLALQQDPNVADETNGFEGDNEPAVPATGPSVPTSEPTIYNATLCGKNMDLDKQQYGMLIRRATKAHIFNTIATGFESGYDLRDKDTSLELKSSIFFGNLAAGANVAYAETTPTAEGTIKDDDLAFDEIAAFETAANNNSTIDPKIKDCFNRTTGPDFTPAATLTDKAAKPPTDGFFDDTASYIGAFKAGDTWATGKWVDYSRK